MMQHSKKGYWGRGLYFAVDAGYCDTLGGGFASTASKTPNAPGRPPLQPDERELLQASLLLGRVIEMDRDKPGMKERCK